MSKELENLPAFDPSRPYNALPPLPPRADIETTAIMRKCVAASRALAELKQACGLVPNADVIINTIPLREARDSSAIENIITTNDRLFRYAGIDERGADPETKETLRYRRALWEGYQELKSRPLTTNTATKVCQTIKGTKLDIRKTPGTALTNDATGETIYTPPEGENLLRDKLKNWEAFLHGDEGIDPLIKMAIGHYQFEAIHPFTDGNGRTGRVVNILYLIDRGLLDIPVLYLSRHIIANKNDYYGLLAGVTENGDWEAWIIYMLDAVKQTAEWTTAKIRGIKELLDHTLEYVSEAAPKTYRHELVELIFVQPYSRIGHITDAKIAKRRTASTYLKEFCKIGVLEEYKAGRNKLFIHAKFLKLLMSDEHQFDPYKMES